MAMPTATDSSNTRGAASEGLVQQGWKDSHDSVFHSDGKLAAGADRAVRGAGLRLRRPSWPSPSWRALMDEPQLAAVARARRREQLRRALPGRLLVRGDRQLCDRAGRRQAAVQGAVVQRRTHALERHRVTRACAAHRRRTDGPGVLQRLGHSHHRSRRGALQPDVVSQRLDLAARQRLDRRRHGALRPHRERDAAALEHLRRQPALRHAPPAGAVLRVPAALRAPGPTLYPVACSPQAWAAAAVFGMLQACLGLDIDARPVGDRAAARRGCRRSSTGSGLPGWARPGPSVDLLLQRYERNVGLEVVRKDPDVQGHGRGLENRLGLHQAPCSSFVRRLRLAAEVLWMA